MEACSLLVNLRKGMQSSSEQPLVGEERYVTTLITAAKETSSFSDDKFSRQILFDFLGKAGGGGMCLTDSPSHFQGLSILGASEELRRLCIRGCFLSYIH